MPRSKRYNQTTKLVDRNKLYPLEEVINLVKKTATTKFDASLEVHINLGIDPKKGEQQVRGSVTLPHGLGKSKRVAVFTETKAEEVKRAGADLVGGQELIEKIKQTQKCDFEVAVAEPEMMSKLAQIAKILGPKGLMPSPKNETVTPNLVKTVGELKKGKITFKNDDGGNIHQLIGKVSFDNQKLIDNFNTLLEAVRRTKPPSAKGVFIRGITICSSMGPGVKVAI